MITLKDVKISKEFSGYYIYEGVNFTVKFNSEECESFWWEVAYWEDNTDKAVVSYFEDYNRFDRKKDVIYALLQVDNNLENEKQIKKTVMKKDEKEFVSDMHLTVINKSTMLTENEGYVMTYLANALSGNYGETYSSVDVEEISHAVGMSTATVKGIVGSLTKKGIVGTYDSQSDNDKTYHFIYLIDQVEMTPYKMRLILNNRKPLIGTKNATVKTKQVKTDKMKKAKSVKMATVMKTAKKKYIARKKAKATPKKATAKAKAPKRQSLKDLATSKKNNEKVLYVVYRVRKIVGQKMSDNAKASKKSAKEIVQINKRLSNSMSGIKAGLLRVTDDKVLRPIANSLKPILSDMSNDKYSAKMKEVFEKLSEQFPQATRKAKKTVIATNFLDF